jgi:hypothetical protein
VYNWLGFVLWSAMAIAVANALGRRYSAAAARLLVLAIILRVVGSLLRYEVLMQFYRGVGDARVYYSTGWAMARDLWSLQAPLLSPEFWMDNSGRWWGTPMMEKFSGFVLAIIGPSIRAEFLAFSLLAFWGSFLIVSSLRRLQPAQSLEFAALVWLWPSLWFWPSSVGKEALMVLAMGMTTLGYVGRNGKTQWHLLLLGIALAFIIRPHVAAVLALASVAGFWVGSWRQLTPRRLVEAAGALALAIAAFFGMREQFGFEADLEGVLEFVESTQERTLKGGSNIGTLPSGPIAVPVAFVNLWMRPFPWEAHNATALFAALEILALWYLVWRHRRHVGWMVKNWWRHRLLRFALPLIVVYTLMLGLTFANLGIIARQRAPLFLFVFLLLVAAPEYRAQVSPAASPAWRPLGAAVRPEGAVAAQRSASG